MKRKVREISVSLGKMYDRVNKFKDVLEQMEDVDRHLVDRLGNAAIAIIEAWTATGSYVDAKNSTDG